MMLDKTLKEIFGETATDTIYSYLEDRCQIRKEEIPYKMEEFKNVLEKILGNAAKIVEGRIDEKLDHINEEEK